MYNLNVGVPVSMSKISEHLKANGVHGIYTARPFSFSLENLPFFQVCKNCFFSLENCFCYWVFTKQFLSINFAIVTILARDKNQLVSN